MGVRNLQPGQGQVSRRIGQVVMPTSSIQHRRRIPDLRPGEVVVALLHRHPLALLKSLAWPLVLLLLWATSAIVVVPFLASLQVDPFLAVNPPPEWLAPFLWTAWL